jgi:hypothetical protein
MKIILNRFDNNNRFEFLIETKRKLLRIFIILSFCIPSTLLAQNCIENLDGITLEKIQHYKLLVKQNGKNIAIITTYSTVYLTNPIIPDQIKQIRFFSQKLCTLSAESKFHINGELYEVSTIEHFR